MNLRSTQKPILGQRSNLNTKHVTCMTSKPEPAIWSCGIGQQALSFDMCRWHHPLSCNIRDVCCKPRLRNGISWSVAVMSRDVVVVSRHRRLGMAQAPTIHAASHVDHPNGVPWFSISMHVCGFLPVVMVGSLVDLFDRAVRINPIVPKFRCFNFMLLISVYVVRLRKLISRSVMFATSNKINDSSKFIFLL